MGLMLDSTEVNVSRVRICLSCIHLYNCTRLSHPPPPANPTCRWLNWLEGRFEKARRWGREKAHGDTSWLLSQRQLRFLETSNTHRQCSKAHVLSHSLLSWHPLSAAIFLTYVMRKQPWPKWALGAVKVQHFFLRQCDITIEWSVSWL